MTSEIALRRMRQRIFDYPPEKEAQADRVLAYLQERVIRERCWAWARAKTRQETGPYSGLTREELARTGTCEPDWF